MATFSVHSHATIHNTHNRTLLPPQAITSARIPEARTDSKLSVTFIMREYLSKQLTSLSQLLFLSADAFIFQSHALIFQDWVTDPVKNEKREGAAGMARKVQGGMGNHIWFCRSYKWLKSCRCQSDYLNLHHLHQFHLRLLSLCISLSPLVGIVSYKSMMVAGPNFTVPQWVCNGRTRDKQSRMHYPAAPILSANWDQHFQTFRDKWKHAKLNLIQ